MFMVPHVAPNKHSRWRLHSMFRSSVKAGWSRITNASVSPTKRNDKAFHWPESQELSCPVLFPPPPSQRAPPILFLVSGDTF